MSYKTRKHQIEKDFLPRCLEEPTRRVIKAELRGAAMVGAAEERSRTLKILRDAGNHPALAEIAERIMAMGVLEVLGY